MMRAASVPPVDRSPAATRDDRAFARAVRRLEAWGRWLRAAVPDVPTDCANRDAVLALVWERRLAAEQWNPPSEPTTPGITAARRAWTREATMFLDLLRRERHADRRSEG